MKNSKEKLKTGSFETVMNSIADYVSSDPEIAKEYLREEGVDAEKQSNEDMAFIRNLQTKAREKLAVKE